MEASWLDGFGPISISGIPESTPSGAAVALPPIRAGYIHSHASSASGAAVALHGQTTRPVQDPIPEPIPDHTLPNHTRPNWALRDYHPSHAIPDPSQPGPTGPYQTLTSASKS
jgi:hypothetical protein